MPAPLNVDKEAVRVLVVAVGVREAARQMQLNENTVLDWSRAGQWLADCRPTPAKMPPPASMVGAISPIKPADALANTLLERQKQTRLGFSKWVAKVATDAGENPTLADAQNLKHAAGVAAHVWPQEQQSGPLAIINVALIGRALEEMPVIDA